MVRQPREPAPVQVRPCGCWAKVWTRCECRTFARSPEPTAHPIWVIAAVTRPRRPACRCCPASTCWPLPAGAGARLVAATGPRPGAPPAHRLIGDGSVRRLPSGGGARAAGSSHRLILGRSWVDPDLPVRCRRGRSARVLVVGGRSGRGRQHRGMRERGRRGTDAALARVVRGNTEPGAASSARHPHRPSRQPGPAAHPAQPRTRLPSAAAGRDPAHGAVQTVPRLTGVLSPVLTTAWTETV